MTSSHHDEIHQPDEEEQVDKLFLRHHDNIRAVLGVNFWFLLLITNTFPLGSWIMKSRIQWNCSIYILGVQNILMFDACINVFIQQRS